MAQIVLHIGTHKTGTTSLQSYLHEHAALLKSKGILYPDLTNQFGKITHFGFNVFALDRDRDSPALRRLLRRPGFDLDVYRSRFANHIRSILQDASDKVIFSNEGLSYLRRPAEAARLAELFAGHHVEVVVCFRDKEKYMASYRREMLDAGYGESDDPSSAFYYGADSWLLDYDSLLNCFADSFGPDQITVLDYDQTVSRDGTILPAMLEAMGVPAFESPERDSIWLNKGSDKSS